ncbi:MAG TPA: OmpH family outer membrane protein [Verrucomicrobiae bacterium]|jgi:Skp family chaperone for outer membrane proteins|nr:OmpH family outer membrane protein [Verrucomicrobiae bacterium]
MMKNAVSILARILAGFALATCLSSSAQTPQKIAFVDMKKAFDTYYKKDEAEKSIKDRAADSDKVYKGMIEDYKKANEDYKKLVDSSNDQAVSAEEREKRKKSAETKLMELQEIEKSVKQFESSTRTSLGEMEKRMREKIVGEIIDVVKVQAKTGGYTIVLDSASLTGYQTPIILYTNGEHDLTENVIKEINANAPAKALSNNAGTPSTGKK